MDYVQLAQSRMAADAQRQADNAAGVDGRGSLGSAIRSGAAQDWVLRRMGAEGKQAGLSIRPEELAGHMEGLGDIGVQGQGGGGVVDELRRQGVVVRRQRFVAG